MVVKLNQQQRWLVEKVAASEGFTGTLDEFVTEVVKRYVAEMRSAVVQPAAAR